MRCPVLSFVPFNELGWVCDALLSGFVENPDHIALKPSFLLDCLETEPHPTD